MDLRTHGEGKGGTGVRVELGDPHVRVSRAVPEEPPRKEPRSPKLGSQRAAYVPGRHQGERPPEPGEATAQDGVSQGTPAEVGGEETGKSSGFQIHVGIGIKT